MRSLAVLASSLLFAQSGHAKYECDTSLGSFYSFCVNVPDNASGKLPTILMLSGSGARNDGDSSKVKMLSGYDGYGKVVNQYLSGNKGADQVMAGEQFITVIPISPMKTPSGGEARHWRPDALDAVLDAVSAKYPVDEDRIHCAGYSMGARGCWRYSVNRPTKLASTMSSAGAAERAGDGTLSQEKADPTFPLLKNIVNLPVWQFAGSSDSTAGTESPKATEAELEKLGSTIAKLSIENTDHSGMSTMPFNSAHMKWMLQQKRGGGSSSSEDSSSGSSDDDSSVGEKVKDTTDASVTGSSASGTKNNTVQTSSSGKCKRRRAKRAVHKQVRRGLTLDAILTATGRNLQPFNATISTSKSAAVIVTPKNTTESSTTNEKRGLTLTQIVASREQKEKRAVASVQTPVERRATSGVRSLPINGQKMARRMK